MDKDVIANESVYSFIEFYTDKRIAEFMQDDDIIGRLLTEKFNGDPRS